MRTAGKGSLAIWSLTIATGGVLLGALLGRAADPDMKDPPAPWWQQEDDGAAALPPEDTFAEADPEYLSPFGGYRPDLDYDAEVWASPIPEYELAPLFDEPTWKLADELPEPGFGSTAEAAADAAVAVAEAATDAAAAPEPAPAEVRKSDLAKAGLY